MKTKQQNKLTEGDIDALCDWAARDQDECRQCGDSEEAQKECEQNLADIETLRPLLMAAPALLEAAQAADVLFSGLDAKGALLWPGRQQWAKVREAIRRAEGKSE